VEWEGRTYVRITAQARELTRRKILEKSHQLFCLVGFEVATIRDIAKAVGVAPGTLFNYFPSKEAIAAAVVMKQSARGRFNETQYDSFEEALFALAARTMRQWKACRNYIHAALEPTLSLGEFTDSSGCFYELRDLHLTQVKRLSQIYVSRNPLAHLELHLYWTLFFGVIAFWSRDPSRKQEATLALLDDSVNMFAGWVESGPARNQLREAPSRP
jgi:AcrR family transcriptional regulator